MEADAAVARPHRLDRPQVDPVVRELGLSFHHTCTYTLYGQWARTSFSQATRCHAKPNQASTPINEHVLRVSQW